MLLNANVLAAQTAHKMKYLLADNSTLILTGVGAVGTVGTAVLTGRASFKAAELIAEREKIRQLTEEDDKAKLSKTEKVKIVFPHYIPPVLLCGVTVASIIMANRISSKQVAGLVVASTVSERAFQEYKDKVVEKLGPKQSTSLDDELAQDKVNRTPPSGQVIIAGSGDVLCLEPLTGRYFTSTIETIKQAENKINYEIIHFDFCSLTQFFEEIGLSPTDYSDSVGWNVANRLEMQFSTAMSEDNRPCLVLGYSRMPHADYNKSFSISGG